MTKRHIEFVLSGYGVPFTDSLADKLLEMFDEEAASYQHTINKLNKVLSENKGEWIKFKNEYKCSKCGHIMDKVLSVSGNLIHQYSNFCPDCGADMREPKPIGVFNCLNDSVTGECIQDLREPKEEEGGAS